MLIGIDVGGTYTDGVLYHNRKILKTTKKPTETDNLTSTLLKVLDNLLEQQDVSEIKRIVLSTTLVTNLLASGYEEKIAVILLPGPGLPVTYFNLFPYTFMLKGSIDFRGRRIEKIDVREAEKLVIRLNNEGFRKFVVVSKFSNRNNTLELQIRDIIKDTLPEAKIMLGSQIAGQLNFPRRLVTTYYSFLTQDPWQRFATEIQAAFHARDISADLYFLKADGGTMPIDIAVNKPCETVFSGPAASIMGAVALQKEPENAIVLDIGGTTTDIGLLIDGKPLYASRGAKINGHFTHINAMSVYSLALGGDTPVHITEGKINISNSRKGPAACLGGTNLTITDIFNIKSNLRLGDYRKSMELLGEMAKSCGLQAQYIAEQVVEETVKKIESAVKMMFAEWENEPAYKVWEIVHGKSFTAAEVIGIGAAAPAIVPTVAETMQLKSYINEYSPVANALGACAARPTLTMNMHIDTSQRYYFIDVNGKQENQNFSWNYQLADAKKLAVEEFRMITKQMEIEKYADCYEFFREEQFNLIRDWDREGKIFDIGLQISPGLIDEYEGVGI